MLKKLYELAAQVLNLTRDLQQNKADIVEVRQEIKEIRQEMTELRREMRDIAEGLQRVAYEIHRMGENDAHEREKLTLKLENQLLRFERRLSPGKPVDEE